MRTSRSVRALFAACVLCLSTVVGTSDIPNTSYDESEPPPYECAPQPPGDLFGTDRLAAEPAPRSPVAQDFKSLKGVRLHSPIRTGGVACTSLVILDHALRC